AFTANLLQSLATHYDFDLNTPYEELPESIHQVLLHGSGDEEIDFIYMNEQGEHFTRRHTFEGVIPNLERRWRETESTAVKEELGKLRHSVHCPSCQGARLCAQARHVRIGTELGPGEERGLAIYELEALSLTECLDWFESLQLQGAKQEIAQGLIQGICARLYFLDNVGLGYLTLDRTANTLSGGESQRIRLASQIGSGLAGVMYVLDEPSIGLHQRDNDRLIQTLRKLRNLGNSIIVVEHDEDRIRDADPIIDMGPGAGEHGGHVIAQGSPDEIMAEPRSLTGQYLNGEQRIEPPRRRPVHHTGDEATPQLSLYGARGHNLKNVDLQLPLGRLIFLTGAVGEHVGQIIAQVSPDEIMAEPRSLTGQYLNGEQRIEPPRRRPVHHTGDEATPQLSLYGARGHNLKNVDLHLPLGRLICITGVSGSGKSTLINDTLGKALARDLNRAHSQPEPFDEIKGLEHLDKLI